MTPELLDELERLEKESHENSFRMTAYLSKLQDAAPSLIQSLRSLMAENERLQKERDTMRSLKEAYFRSDMEVREQRDTLKAENEWLKKENASLCESFDEMQKLANESFGNGRRDGMEERDTLEAQLKESVEAIEKIIDHAECMQIRYKAEEDRLKAALDIRDARKVLAKLGAAQKEGGMHPNWYSEDSAGTVYSKAHGDSEVTCRSCKRTFITDPMDAACRLCGNWLSAKRAAQKEGGK